MSEIIIPTYYVPSFVLPREELAEVSGIARNVVQTLYDEVLKSPKPVPYVHEELLRAVRASELDLSKPRTTQFYNYVVGIYNDSAEAPFDGLVFRVGKYDPEGPMVDKASWQLESRMGIKHLQLRGPDVDALFSGVLINDPVKGVTVTPSSGLWAARKAKVGKVDPVTDAAMDLMNVVVTRAILKALASPKARSKKYDDFVFESRYRSRVLRTPIKFQGFSEDCMDAYVRRLKDPQTPMADARCMANIPTMTGSNDGNAVPPKKKRLGRKR
jgi:hypothetical protein